MNCILGENTNLNVENTSVRILGLEFGDKSSEIWDALNILNLTKDDLLTDLGVMNNRFSRPKQELKCNNDCILRFYEFY